MISTRGKRAGATKTRDALLRPEMNRLRAEFDGVVLVRKPPDITSRDVVNHAIRQLGRRDIGHAGTLDPFATGLLQIVVGRGTKLVPFLHEWSKEYRAVVRLGEATDTLDRTGRVTARGEIPPDASERLDSTVASLTGPQMQAPPMFSAVRVGGVRLHELARTGATVERKPRPVIIHRVEILSRNLPRVELLVVCSSGTYVRVLAESLGDRLGVPAHLSSLERTAVGPHRVSDAVELEDLDPGARPRQSWLELPGVLSDWPVWSVNADGAQDIKNGRVPSTFMSDFNPALFPARCRVLAPSGDMLALLECGSRDEQPVFLRGFSEGR